MKRTPIYELHVEQGAKMGEYAGWEMPLFYPLGVKSEHLHTREKAGLFDISHMMHVEVTGKDAGAYLGHLCPCEPASQELGQARYTFFLNEDAGIIDDLIITRLANDRYLVVANAGCAEKDFAHMEAHLHGFDVSLNRRDCGFLALQGPEAEAVLSDAGFAVDSMRFMTGTEPSQGWFLSRTGYTGEDGFEIAMPSGELPEFAVKLSGDRRVEWVGLAARDSLRLEAGLSLYGQDLDETITPHEAALMWAIPKELRENGKFVGADALASKLAAGRTRQRLGLLPDGRPVRAGSTLVNEAGEEIGTVTSGGFGPTLGAPMALGLVSCDAADKPIFADMRGKKVVMTRTTLPFVPHNYKR